MSTSGSTLENSAVDLASYVIEHTARGECKCGKCFDVGHNPDPQGHTADLIFFKMIATGSPSAEEFRRLTNEHKGHYNECDPFDGNEHGYMELGGWIGDQGVALQYMGLGHLLGLFSLLTPRSVLGNEIPEKLVMEMAGSGLVTIRKAEAKVA